MGGMTYPRAELNNLQRSYSLAFIAMRDIVTIMITDT